MSEKMLTADEVAAIMRAAWGHEVQDSQNASPETIKQLCVMAMAGLAKIQELPERGVAIVDLEGSIAEEHNTWHELANVFHPLPVVLKQPDHSIEVMSDEDLERIGLVRIAATTQPHNWEQDYMDLHAMHTELLNSDAQKRVRELEAELSAMRADLDAARSGWESAAEDLREIEAEREAQQPPEPASAVIAEMRARAEKARAAACMLGAPEVIDWADRLERASWGGEAEVARDAEMFRWLVDTKCLRAGSIDISGSHTWVAAGRTIGRGATVREAISNAMAAAKGEQT